LFHNDIGLVDELIFIYDVYFRKKLQYFEKELQLFSDVVRIIEKTAIGNIALPMAVS
jgi:hypothetical protein